MLWPKKNSYKEFDNEKNSCGSKIPLPPPLMTFLMVRPLVPLIVLLLVRSPPSYMQIKSLLASSVNAHFASNYPTLSPLRPDTTATSLQRPFFGADSPYIHSCFNLFTTAISLQWPFSSVPKVAVVKRFNCITNLKLREKGL